MFNQGEIDALIKDAPVECGIPHKLCHDIINMLKYFKVLGVETPSVSASGKTLSLKWDLVQNNITCSMDISSETGLVECVLRKDSQVIDSFQFKLDASMLSVGTRISDIVK